MSASANARLFAGAKEVSIIDGYDKALTLNKFQLLIDWRWFYFVTKPNVRGHRLCWQASPPGYWAWNNTLSVLQQGVIMRALGRVSPSGPRKARPDDRLRRNPPAWYIESADYAEFILGPAKAGPEG